MTAAPFRGFLVYTTFVRESYSVGSLIRYLAGEN